MTSPKWNFFHVTSYDTMIRILDHNGIDPAFSQGKRRVAWYVTRKNVAWAIAHVAMRHDVELDEVCILRIQAPIQEMVKTAKTGVYCTVNTYYPMTIDSAKIWLGREEHGVYVKGTKTKPGRWYGYTRNGSKDVPEL